MGCQGNVNNSVKKSAVNLFTSMVLVECQEEHAACKKNSVMSSWHDYLSAARCKWFACGPADAAATSSLALSKSRLV